MATTERMGKETPSLRWAMTTAEADRENPKWSEPRRISNGVMMNKPVVRKDGVWLLSVGYWRDNTNVPNIKFNEKEIAPYTNAGLAHDLGELSRVHDAGRQDDRGGKRRGRGRG